MNIDARWYLCASGSVTAITIRKSATEALVENHLWPLMTQASPSSTARVCSSVGSLPAVSGSVIENAERRSPASSGCSHCCFWSSVPASASTSELPESGAALPNTNGANGLEPRISCIRPSLTWPKPWPPRSGGRCAAHRPRSRTCSCSGAIARTKPSWPSSSNTVSIGHTSSRTKSRIQSSCAWNSGSVEKSQAMRGILGPCWLSAAGCVQRSPDAWIAVTAGRAATARRRRERATWPGVRHGPASVLAARRAARVRARSSRARRSAC